MHNYQLKVPHEHEAFILGIKLTIEQWNPIPQYTSTETKNATIFFLEFEEEDDLYSFDKEIRSSLPFLFESY